MAVSQYANHPDWPADLAEREAVYEEGAGSITPRPAITACRSAAFSIDQLLCFAAIGAASWLTVIGIVWAALVIAGVE